MSEGQQLCCEEGDLQQQWEQFFNQKLAGSVLFRQSEPCNQIWERKKQVDLNSFTQKDLDQFSIQQTLSYTDQLKFELLDTTTSTESVLKNQEITTSPFQQQQNIQEKFQLRCNLPKIVREPLKFLKDEPEKQIQQQEQELIDILLDQNQQSSSSSKSTSSNQDSNKGNTNIDPIFIKKLQQLFSDDDDYSGSKNEYQFNIKNIINQYKPQKLLLKYTNTIDNNNQQQQQQQQIYCENKKFHDQQQHQKLQTGNKMLEIDDKIRNQQLMKQNSCDLEVDQFSCKEENSCDLNLILDQLLFKQSTNNQDKYISCSSLSISNGDSCTDILTDTDQVTERSAKNFQNSLYTLGAKFEESWPQIQSDNTDFWRCADDGWGALEPPQDDLQILQNILLNKTINSDFEFEQSDSDSNNKATTTQLIRNAKSEADLQSTQNINNKQQQQLYLYQNKCKIFKNFGKSFLSRTWCQNRMTVDQIQKIYLTERQNALKLEQQAQENQKLLEEALEKKEYDEVVKFAKLKEDCVASSKCEHRLAAKRIVSKINQNIQSMDCLDLHGLHCWEAMQKLEEYLLVVQDMVACLGSERCVLIITGQGSHSANGEGLIKQRVLKKLQDEDFCFYPQNEGSFMVVVQPKIQNSNFL